MKNNKKFKYIRLFLYVLTIITFILLKFSDFDFGKCYIRESLGVFCPSCGITRATKEILNLNFPLAMEYNAYYSLVLFPIFLILFIDDIVCIFIKKRSFVDIIFGD